MDSQSDKIDTLRVEAATYLEAARGVANEQFGLQTVENVPLLVTQVAWLMATIETNRMSEIE